MERMATKDVTEALARAMEYADRMRNVVILYDSHDGDPNPGGMISNDEMTIAELNYLFDLGKKWIFD